MKIQVTWDQFKLVFALMSAQAIVFYMVEDRGTGDVVSKVMIRDPKLGGTGIDLITDWPTEATFKLTSPLAVRVTDIVS